MKKQRQRLLLCLLAGLAAAGGIWYLVGVARYQQEAAAITIQSLDFREIPDGSYEGSCDIGLVAARVLVLVQGGRVEEIRLLEHKNGRGEPAERLVEEITERQTLEVECVAGATNSSMVIRKAVENALRGVTGNG